MFQTGNTNRQVVQAFRLLIADKGRISDDSAVSTRHVLFNLLRYRAFMLNERFHARRPISRYNYQTIPCIGLEEVDKHECPCAPKSGCSFLKTKVTIPVPIGGFKSITSIDGGINYTYVEWDKFKYKLDSRIKGTKVAAYYTTKTSVAGTFIYVYNDIHKKFLTITSMFENPIDVQSLPTCDGVQDKCTRPLDREFILDPELFGLVTELTITKVYRYQVQTTDGHNNDKEDQVSNPTQIK